jgi:DNA-binding beta-propeller fold protein YncE
VIYAGDLAVAVTRDGPRSSATFRAPFGLALSPQNELYVTDEADNVVRKISKDTVTTISGAAGFVGATEGQFARFHGPRGVTVTPLDGFVYVADTQNQEIRILYTGGAFVPAFVVGGAAELSGYVDDVADRSRFNLPSGIAATPRGDLYVADTQNNLIRKMTQIAGTIGLFTISTFARDLHSPMGVAVGANEAVYVVDTGDNTIRKFVNGTVSVLAGESGVSGNSDGRGAEAHFDHPIGVAVDARGNLFATDRNGVRRIAPSGLVTTVARGFNSLAGIVVDASDRLLVADPDAHVIRLIEPAAAPPPAVGARRRAAH